MRDLATKRQEIDHTKTRHCSQKDRVDGRRHFSKKRHADERSEAQFLN